MHSRGEGLSRFSRSYRMLEKTMPNDCDLVHSGDSGH